ncbi:unnamed protein product [Meloidogyne enterolobii]|uniref:Uncharacterized protein n=1 Tax=Meloidogyne enterolobii TaxID=390850 RepID=A0ACB0XRS6_MELEN
MTTGLFHCSCTSLFLLHIWSSIFNMTQENYGKSLYLNRKKKDSKGEMVRLF